MPMWLCLLCIWVHINATLKLAVEEIRPFFVLTKAMWKPLQELSEFEGCVNVVLTRARETHNMRESSPTAGSIRHSFGPSSFFHPFDVDTSNERSLAQSFSHCQLPSVTLSAAPHSPPSLPIVTLLRRCRSRSYPFSLSLPLSPLLNTNSPQSSNGFRAVGPSVISSWSSISCLRFRPILLLPSIRFSPNRPEGSRISSWEDIRAFLGGEFPIFLEMASSLEALLAEEGFRGRRSMTRSRASFGSDNVTTPLYSSRGQHKPHSSSVNRTRTQRTRSDVSRYSFNGRLGKSDSLGSTQPRDNLITRERMNGKGMEPLEGRGDMERLGDRRFEVSSDAFSRNEIVEVGVENSERIKNVYLSVGKGPLRMEKYLAAGDESTDSMGNNMKSDRRGPSSSKHLLGDPSSARNGRTSTKPAGPFENSRLEKHVQSTLSDSLPALDEVAIRAIVSILIGYITPFLKDKDFRINLRDKCFLSLNFVESEEYQNGESKVICNLAQAIETVERAAEEYRDPKDLKRASLQLSVITGLNAGELKNGFTCGVPNCKLSACAHLYLSVIYKINKKDRVSAKHILQVFADSPLQGRRLLLPELWENFFYPHLSHLQLWHSQEVDSLVDATSRARKLKLLDKVYNEILDSGTRQFAVYYKDWLTEGSEAPLFPSINIPSVSVDTVELTDSLSHSGELGNPVSAPHPQPMVSKKLYEAMFGCSNKSGAEDDEGENCRKSSGGSSFDFKETSTHSYETVKYMDQHSIANSAKRLEDEGFPEDGLLLTVDKERGLLKASVSVQEDENDEISNSSSRQQMTVETELRYSPQTNNVSELKRLAKSVFQPEQTDGFDIKMDIPSRPNAESVTEHLAKVVKAKSSLQELYRSDKYSGEGSSTIPQYLICPLTRQLFEDPVTLETGQTFERAAIQKWFDEGNKTCPVTGNSLECLSVPLTNMVINCVIDSWKSKHCQNILAFASQMMEEKEGRDFAHPDDGSISMLEQLITIYSKEERIANLKHLISLGGVQYLIRRFSLGTTEEKIRVAALLICCIEADASCRDQIAKAINIQVLIELLRSKQIEARTNAVSLLAELICRKRRKDVTDILRGLPKEEMVNVGPQKYSIYREEAVDAIAVALNLSLTDENVKETCCKALSILGGCLSPSGKLTEAGFDVSCQANLKDNKEHGSPQDHAILYGDENLAHEQWLRYLLTSLLGNEKKSFLEAISKCLALGESNLVLACLKMVAWLSYVLSSLSDIECQLSTFAGLVRQLKENLQGGEEEHRILASFSLMNFSKIPDA
ncbi:hypothetical protein CRG98_018516 [Punica granatum]|uniref:RING-type E3 ubiquitin transferase n=1 Tax=Punica granatum TaxID=22663 RepID=A0A2I0JXP8_PUNGR|nr:hypothetical protein CRG98_018516 [Punica granatum]